MWAIQKDCDRFEEWIEALDHNNIKYEIIPNLLHLPDLTNVEMCYGDINFCKFVHWKTNWNLFFDFKKCYYSNFAGKLNHSLLNYPYIIQTLEDIKHTEIFKLGDYDAERSDKSIFMRPNRSDKPFSGGLFYQKEFSREVDDLLRYVDPEELVVISEPKKIIHEDRHIVHNRQIKFSARYITNGEIEDSVTPTDVVEDAQRLVKYCPEDWFVLDTCVLEDGIKIVELNCLSSSGTYGINLKELVKEIDRTLCLL